MCHTHLAPWSMTGVCGALDSVTYRPDEHQSQTL